MASAFQDEDKPIRKPVHEIGQDLSALSLDELEERVQILQKEIERLNLARTSKSASRQAADAVFKF